MDTKKIVLLLLILILTLLVFLYICISGKERGTELSMLVAEEYSSINSREKTIEAVPVTSVVKVPDISQDMIKDEFYELITGTTTPVEKIDKTNWKNYVNKEYGFAVQYPEDFELLVENQKLVDGKVITFSKGSFVFYLGVVENTDNEKGMSSKSTAQYVYINGIKTTVMKQLYADSLADHAIDLKFVKDDIEYYFGEGLGVYPDYRLEIIGMIDSFRFIQ